jgi:hypothetical protein
MNIAVLKYQFVTEKPVGIPDEWPAETINLGDSITLPGENWVLMTDSEYQDYITTNQSSYDTWFDTILLEEKKKIRIVEIDKRTQDIIAEGFEFDSHQFSLSLNAQINWSGLLTLQSMLTWPMAVTTFDDNEYVLELSNLPSFIATGKAVILNAINTGRAIKVQVNAATTLEELNAIVDTR